MELISKRKGISPELCSTLVEMEFTSKRRMEIKLISKRGLSSELCFGPLMEMELIFKWGMEMDFISKRRMEMEWISKRKGMSPELCSTPAGNGVDFQNKRRMDAKLQHLGQEFCLFPFHSWNCLQAPGCKQGLAVPALC